MLQKIKNYSEEKPLHFLLGLGLLLRLIAVIFSKGYGMTDDHFKIIEEAQSLLIGVWTDEWKPIEGTGGGKRSMLYPYLHYVLFKLLESIQVFDPQLKMYIVRFIHAIYSLFTIYFSYQITKILSNEKTAFRIGLIAALFWFLPMMSVRNLVEVVSLPLLLGGTYFILLGEERKRKAMIFFWAGIVLSFAFTIRFQAASFIAGLVFYLLWKREFKAVILLAIGGILPFVLNHIVLESVHFDFPLFGKIINYIDFNLENSTTYVIGPWYNYLLLILGVFIPPLSILFLVGMIKAWKKYLILFLPFICFFIFHSFFPGKQERFVLPILMFFPMMGMMGFEDLMKGDNWFSKRPKLYAASWKVFWVLNIILLIPITLTYSKRSKVEVMYFLADKPTHKKDFLVYCAESYGKIGNMPYFYMQAEKYPIYFPIAKDHGFENFSDIINVLPPEGHPDYLFFFPFEGMEDRMQEFKTLFPRMEYVKSIQSGNIDKLMHWLNPRNQNYVIEVYEINPE